MLSEQNYHHKQGSLMNTIQMKEMFDNHAAAFTATSNIILIRVCLYFRILVKML